jgi:hypothetical protein
VSGGFSSLDPAEQLLDPGLNFSKFVFGELSQLFGKPGATNRLDLLHVEGPRLQKVLRDCHFTIGYRAELSYVARPYKASNR